MRCTLQGAFEDKLSSRGVEWASTKVCPESYATALVKPRIGLVEASLKISVRITNQQGFIAKFPAYLHWRSCITFGTDLRRADE
jgi:hypothetical protein